MNAFYRAAVASLEAGRTLSQVQERTVAKYDRLRLDELDARWERYVDTATAATYGKPSNYISETRARNIQAGRRRRAGLAPRETVALEMRRLAEAALLDQIEAASSAVAARLQAELGEATALRARLAAHIESSWLLA